MSTEITGFFFKQNAEVLGKLYDSGSFCVLLKTDIRKGREYYSIEAMYPKPRVYKMFTHPVVWYKWRNFF
jgi:hypothetical protein